MGLGDLSELLHAQLALELLVTYAREYHQFGDRIDGLRSLVELLALVDHLLGLGLGDGDGDGNGDGQDHGLFIDL